MSHTTDNKVTVRVQVRAAGGITIVQKPAVIKMNLN